MIHKYKQLPSKGSLHFLMPGCSSLYNETDVAWMTDLVLAKHNSREWVSHGKSGQVNSVGPKHNGAVLHLVSQLFGSLTDHCAHRTPLLSALSQVLTFMHSSELVHPGFSSRAKIPKGNMWCFLVDGGICPLSHFNKVWFAVITPGAQEPVLGTLPPQSPLFSCLRCPVGKHCFCPWKFQA